MFYRKFEKSFIKSLSGFCALLETEKMNLQNQSKALLSKYTQLFQFSLVFVLKNNKNHENEPGNDIKFHNSRMIAFAEGQNMHFEHCWPYILLKSIKPSLGYLIKLEFNETSAPLFLAYKPPPKNTIIPVGWDFITRISTSLRLLLQ